MFEYSNLYPLLDQHGMADWAVELQSKLEEYVRNINHGNYPAWKQAIESLPDIKPSSFDFTATAPRIGERKDCSEQEFEQIKTVLKTFIPWRKGPFDLFGIDLDAEWRCDLKWSRVKDKIDLTNKTVLDVGCGNGYYSLRMLGAGADIVVGIDPTLFYLMQYEILKRYLIDNPFYMLPFGIQELSIDKLSFDTVFSMGVIYHRRDPVEHIKQLYNCIKPNGELVIETLVIDEIYGDILVPDGRYAKMKNVWWIPSIRKLSETLSENGFSSIEILDESNTTSQEQRVTQWMSFESLADFLDPNDITKTIEGYPAPKRVLMKAIKIV